MRALTTVSIRDATGRSLPPGMTFMGTQASVGSIDALKTLRTGVGALRRGSARRAGRRRHGGEATTNWVLTDRPNYWQNQIKVRRERLAQAQADLFRKKIAQRPGSAPAMSEQKEAMRIAQAALQDAEARVILVRKWQPLLQQAVLEYHAGTRRLKDLAAGDVPRAVALLERLVDALEAYLRVAPPSGAVLTGPSPFDTIAGAMLDAEPEPAAESQVEDEVVPDERAVDDAVDHPD